MKLRKKRPPVILSAAKDPGSSLWFSDLQTTAGILRSAQDDTFRISSHVPSRGENARPSEFLSPVKGEILQPQRRDTDPFASDAAPDGAQNPLAVNGSRGDDVGATAASGVMSRCGMPKSSKPTMNFRIVAERSSGG